MNTGILTLLFDFIKIGFLSIGGGYAVIPLIKDHVVDERHWLSLGQFTDIITISQMTPGPLAVNTSTFVGLQTAGIAGAVAATFGCVFSGFIISLLLWRVFDRYKASVCGAAVLKGLKAASLGLILSAAVTLSVLALQTAGDSRGLNSSALLLAVTAFFLIQKLRLSPMLVLILSGVAGYCIYR